MRRCARLWEGTRGTPKPLGGMQSSRSAVRAPRVQCAQGKGEWLTIAALGPEGCLPVVLTAMILLHRFF